MELRNDEYVSTQPITGERKNSDMSRAKVIAGVEIGTNKVIVLIGEIQGGRSLNIIGRGECSSLGIKKGEIFDIRAASDCTHAAILAAEKNAGAQIEFVYLSQTGSHLRGFAHAGLTAVSDEESGVTVEDVRRAIENAKNRALEPGRVYLHHVQNGFWLDGQRVEKPLSRVGSQLEARYWHVHGDAKRVSDHIHVINGFGLDVEDMILSSIASGSILATETEKRQGVLVLDIGRGTSDFVLYRDGKILRTGVIAVGGDHLTNDLSLGLRIKTKDAESLKVRAAKAIIDKEDKKEKILLHGDLSIGDRSIPRLAIMILKNKLGSALNSENLPGGVILTGGTSRLPEICHLGELTLGVPVRSGDAPDWVVERDLRGPEYSAVLGLLYYGLRGQCTEEDLPPVRSDTWIKKVTKIFA